MFQQALHFVVVPILAFIAGFGAWLASTGTLILFSAGAARWIAFFVVLLAGPYSLACLVIVARRFYRTYCGWSVVFGHEGIEHTCWKTARVIPYEHVRGVHFFSPFGRESVHIILNDGRLVLAQRYWPVQGIFDEIHARVFPRMTRYVRREMAAGRSVAFGEPKRFMALCMLIMLTVLGVWWFSFLTADGPYAVMQVGFLVVSNLMAFGFIYFLYHRMGGPGIRLGPDGVSSPGRPAVGVTPFEDIADVKTDKRCTIIRAHNWSRPLRISHMISYYDVIKTILAERTAERLVEPGPIDDEDNDIPLPRGPMQYHDTRTVASHPGGLRLSEARLKRVSPELYGIIGRIISVVVHRRWNALKEERERIREHLALGDSLAAVVLRTKPLLVAAYTDELDCVAVLKFDSDFAKTVRLPERARLLTVNTYGFPDEDGLAPDLILGPNNREIYANFHPVIADFVTDDRTTLEKRKSAITEEEWDKAWTMGQAWLKRFGKKARDGSPWLSMVPVE